VRYGIQILNTICNSMFEPPTSSAVGIFPSPSVLNHARPTNLTIDYINTRREFANLEMNKEGQLDSLTMALVIDEVMG